MIDEEGNSIVCPASGKICYTLRESGEVLNGLKVHREGRYFRKKECPKRRYFCTVCRSYHLTHWKSFREEKLPFGAGDENKQTA